MMTTLLLEAAAATWQLHSSTGALARAAAAARAPSVAAGPDGAASSSRSYSVVELLKAKVAACVVTYPPASGSLPPITEGLNASEERPLSAALLPSGSLSAPVPVASSTAMAPAASAASASAATAKVAALDPQPIRLFGACLATQATILYLLGGMRHRLLALQLCFDPAAFRATFADLSEEDLSNLVNHFWVDAWYPLLYGALMWRRAGAVLPRGRERMLLRGLVVLGATCDLVENALHLVALPWLAEAPDALVLCASSAAALKWFVMLSACWRLRPGVASLPSSHASLPSRALLILGRLTAMYEQNGWGCGIIERHESDSGAVSAVEIIRIDDCQQEAAECLIISFRLH